MTQPRRNVALVAALARRDMNQKQLADATGLSRGTVNNAAFRRYTPAPETARAIAKALRMDVAELWPELEV